MFRENDIFSLLQRFHIWSWTQAAYPSRSYVYDVTTSCVMLRWFSKPSKPTPSWFKPQLSYLLLLANGLFSRHWPMTTTPGPSWLKNGFWHDAPLSLLPQLIWIEVKNLLWQIAKLPLAIKKCDSILLIRDDFTCDGQHKDVFESYALSKYRPDKNIRGPPICRTDWNLNEQFLFENISFSKSLDCHHQCVG